MLRIGMILTVSAAFCAGLLEVLSALQIAKFGPCGPDMKGLLLMLAILGLGGPGSVMIVAALIQKLAKSFRSAHS